MKTFSKTPGREISEVIACPICATDAIKALWSLSGCVFVRCRYCGLVYQNPQPIQDDLVERYDDEYFGYEIENEDSFYRLMRLGLDDIDFASVAKSIPQGEKSFLDIGCATGRLISELSREGWDARGVEVCKPAAEYGIRQHGVDIRIGVLEAAGFSSRSFSVIHCSHLIEHLTDPAAFVHHVKRLLVPGGWFIVTTPNIGGFQARLMGKRWRSAIADHMFLFSKRTLRRLLGNAGFAVVATKTWGGIGVGITRDFIKKPVDRAAKKLGLGDVMIILAKAGDDPSGAEISPRSSSS